MLNKYIALGIICSATALAYVPCANASYEYDDYDRYDHYDQGIYDHGRYEQRNHYRSMPVSHKSRRGHTQERVNTQPPPSKIAGGNIVKVDLGRLSWGAYDDQGNLVKWGRVSGGKGYCPDIRRGCRTITGTYTIFRKQGAGCKSSRFPVGKGGAPMPYCMFFHGGYALHGSNSVPNYNASHGCVRMVPADAQWLNQNFVRVGSTRVSITY